MARPPLRTAIALGVLAALAGATAVQGQVVYRYLDPNGRVVYADRPPPDARDVEAKRLTPNYVEIDQASLAAQRAQGRYPVTLYTFSCGDACDRAEALLAKRGVPYTTVNVADSAGAERLKKLTGDLGAPVLQVGDKLVAKGFGEAQWQSLLDTAGYPKQAPARPPPPAEPPPKPAAPPKPGPAVSPGGYPID